MLINVRSNRCPRCLALGHSRANCTGEDRTDKCRRCGIQGHFVAYCEATKQEAEAFKNILRYQASPTNSVTLSSEEGKAPLIPTINGETKQAAEGPSQK